MLAGRTSGSGKTCMLKKQCIERVYASVMSLRKRPWETQNARREEVSTTDAPVKVEVERSDDDDEAKNEVKRRCEKRSRG